MQVRSHNASRSVASSNVASGIDAISNNASKEASSNIIMMQVITQVLTTQQASS
jgi:hypothetical protein